MAHRSRPGDSMILKIEGRSCRHRSGRAFRMAIGAMVFSMTGCAELGQYSQSGNGYPGAKEQVPARSTTRTSAQSVLRHTIPQDSIDPSMRPDPEAFNANGLGLWDGERTLPGVWIAHPMAEIARRVRLTNIETGAKADAAMFRRDPNLTGPRIIVSSEAAIRLGLTPGHATPMTIDGLAYRSETEAANVVASAVEKSEPAHAADPASDPATHPAAYPAAYPAAFPAANPAADPASDPALPGEPPLAEVLVEDTGSEPARSADRTDTAITDAVGQSVDTNVIIPTPRPEAAPASPVSDASGEITDGMHFIQAGIFGQPENAARLMKKLSAANLSVYQLPLILSGRLLTRVLIGPYQSVAERKTALETVRRLGPSDATFIRAPTQAPTQATTQSPAQSPAQPPTQS